MSSTKSTNKASKSSKSSFLSKKGMLIFVLVFAAICAGIVLYANAAPSGGGSGGGGRKAKITLSLSPSSQKVSASGDFTVGVWVNSYSDQINAVQANLTYDATKFDFVSIDGTNSAFELAAQGSGGNGTVYIARAHAGALIGSQLVANVVLKPKVTSGRTTISFASGSAVASYTDHLNILQQTLGGRYSFTP